MFANDMYMSSKKNRVILNLSAIFFVCSGVGMIRMANEFVAKAHKLDDAFKDLEETSAKLKKKNDEADDAIAESNRYTRLANAKLAEYEAKFDEYAGKIKDLDGGLYAQNKSCNNIGEIDPLCGTTRGLTVGEKALLRGFFGPLVPVDKIKIRYYNNANSDGFVLESMPTIIHMNSRYIRTLSRDENGKVNATYRQDLSTEFSEAQATFMHEATHVMQFAKRVAFKNHASETDVTRYAYTLHAGASLRDYNDEAGASIVGDLVKAAYWRQATCNGSENISVAANAERGAKAEADYPLLAATVQRSIPSVSLYLEKNGV